MLSFACLFFATFIAHGLILGGVGVLDEALLQDLEATRAALKLREAIFLVATGLIGPFVGSLIDRWGPRPIVQLGAIILAASLIVYSSAQNLYVIYACHFFFGWAWASTHVIVLAVTISRLTTRRRALWMGILLSATSLGAAAFPLVSSRLLLAVGWRETLLYLSALPALIVIAAAVGIPRFAAVTRDGERRSVTDRLTGIAAAIRQSSGIPRNVLLLAAAALLIFYVSTTVINHAFLYLRDAEASVNFAALGFTAIFLSGLVGKTAAGYLADRWDARRVWMVFQIQMAAGVAILVFLPGAGSWFGLGLFGLGWGGAYALTQVIASTTFAGPRLGQLMGLFLMVEATGSASGGVVTGWIHDELGDYRLPFMAGFVLLVVAMLLTTRLRVQTPPARQ